MTNKTHNESVVCMVGTPSVFIRACLEKNTANLPMSHPCHACTTEKKFDVLNQLTAREMKLFLDDPPLGKGGTERLLPRQGPERVITNA